MELYMGIFHLSWMGFFIVALVLTHVTITGVTIYLHRAQAHLALELGVPLAHFYRCWLWLTTGMVTREWVAIHRKHHAHCEMDGDPHSPTVWLRNVENPALRFVAILWFVVFEGVRKYVRESKNKDTLLRYGHGTPDDWFERNIYTRFPKCGVSTMLVIDIVCFGFLYGPLLWLIQMLWIPIFAAGVINGIGHFFGYRNFESGHRKTGVPDTSKNIVPWGILIGGEELHNNHHEHEPSPKLSVRWFEFDIGWMYICLFEKLGLIKSIRRNRIIDLA